jgi:feruloyl esterase
MKPVSLLTATALAALLASLAHPVFASPQACSGLANTGFPNTLITQAQWQAAGVVILPTGVLPAHCEIQGKINQRVGADGKNYAIGFHLRLPEAWNGRFFFQTQGGNDGNLGSGDGTPGGGAPSTVNQGYATVTTDAGHVPENVPVIGGQLYGLDPQTRVDYGYNSDGTVGRLSKQIIAAYYGSSPRYSYIMGCSNGGRHAMVASQRFPHLFDGYVAGDPGFNLPSAGCGAWDPAFASVAPLHSDGKPIHRSPSPADLTLVANGVAALRQAGRPQTA